MKRKLKTLQELFNMLKEGNKMLEFPTDLKYGEWVDVKMTVHDMYVIGNGIEVWVPESWLEPILTLPEKCGQLMIKGFAFHHRLGKVDVDHEIIFSPDFIKYAQDNKHNNWAYDMTLKPILNKVAL